MEIKELLESRPKKHADLAEVAVQCRASLLCEILLVSLVYGQHQEH